jgi:hypothetical protein
MKIKKFSLFICSSVIAVGIAYYSKRNPIAVVSQKRSDWKTFEKKSNKEVVGHTTTSTELFSARISPNPQRSIAQEKSDHVGFDAKKDLPKDRAYQLREDRILLGDIDKNDYQDEKTELEMINKVSSDWKETLGNDLLRFQREDTKVLIKEEFPIIRVQNGKGQYVEQVIVTYVFKNGNLSSFRALVDSDTGFVIDTWDKMLNEKVNSDGAGITLPEVNNSGIIAR